MLAAVIKFIHLLCVLSLLSVCFSCLLIKDTLIISRLNKIFLIAIGLSLMTGTLLVNLNGFSFHTPWIKSAYLLTSLVLLMVLLLYYFQDAKYPIYAQKIILSILAILLVLIVHDAVRKMTFLTF